MQAQRHTKPLIKFSLDPIDAARDHGGDGHIRVQIRARQAVSPFMLNVVLQVLFVSFVLMVSLW